MPHFGDRLGDEDPDLLRRLRAMLHPPGGTPRPRPTRETPFGEAPLAPEPEPESALTVIASDAEPFSSATS